MQGQTLEAAAAAAGMSERSASTWQDGPMPSATTTTRGWRTRTDPFAAVWATDIEPYLRSDVDGELLATTLMDELCRRRPTEFEPGQVRTLQRQIRRWRAMHGPRQEVFFPQEHQPGHLGAFDFTHCGELGVTIAGVHFVHSRSIAPHRRQRGRQARGDRRGLRRECRDRRGSHVAAGFETRC